MRSQITRDRLSGLINGYCVTQAIACAAALEIADKLATGPRTAAELAALAQCSATHLNRVMRLLCNVGVFNEGVSGYELTPTSEHLRRDCEGSLWPLAVFHGNELYRALGGLLDNVRSGTPAWRTVIGAPVWQYLVEHADRRAVFDDLMRQNHYQIQTIVSAYDFSAARVVVDVGGADGSLLQEILTVYPGASGILLDASDVVNRARASVAWQAAGSRCQFVAGDFFEDIPTAGDVYLLRHILHDWDDERCVRLLRCCREAMSDGARLLVIESLLDTEGDTIRTGLTDLGVMVLGGQERAADEYERLLREAGIVVTRVIPSTAHVSLIEARAV